MDYYEKDVHGTLGTDGREGTRKPSVGWMDGWMDGMSETVIGRDRRTTFF
jgi:hypothetical protein